MAFADTAADRIITEGKRPVKVALSGTVYKGDLIGYSSGWKQADMDSSPKVYPELIAGESGVSGDTITAFREVVMDFGASCSATAGDRIYASTSGGAYVGSASNDQGCLVGVMTGAREAFINPLYAFTNLKFPNTEYSNTSGTVTIMQFKAALAATGTASMTGIEVAPKVLDAVAADTIRGVYVAVDLEGTSAGTVTLVEGVESNIGSDSGTSRTVTSAYCFRAINNLHGTCTNGISVLRVEESGGTVAWAAVLNLAGTESGVWSDTDTGSGDTEAGYFKVLINGNARYVITYSDAPSA
jgi:hypothetical protein